MARAPGAPRGLADGNTVSIYMYFIGARLYTQYIWCTQNMQRMCYRCLAPLHLPLARIALSEKVWESLRRDVVYDNLVSRPYFSHQKYTLLHRITVLDTFIYSGPQGTNSSICPEEEPPTIPTSSSQVYYTYTSFQRASYDQNSMSVGHTQLATTPLPCPTVSLGSTAKPSCLAPPNGCSNRSSPI